MFEEVLRDKTFKYPLHTALVHFPIGLLILSLIMDVAGLLFEPNVFLVRAAFYSMLFGIIMALAAALPGLNDWMRIRSDHPAKAVATNHMILNFAAVGLYLLNVIFRAGDLDTPVVPVFSFILSLLGVGILSVSAYLGGKLIYEDGIAVGRHRRRTPPPRQTVQISEAVAPGHFVPVSHVNSMHEGDSLRVEVNGNVIALVKHGGEIYAFQEFCTHRQGPLSEGSYHNGQVQCPWHNSCFDMRTGEVTQGPAQMNLKTYEVAIGGNMIQILCEPASATPERETEYEVVEIT